VYARGFRGLQKTPIRRAAARAEEIAQARKSPDPALVDVAPMKEDVEGERGNPGETSAMPFLEDERAEVHVREEEDPHPASGPAGRGWRPSARETDQAAAQDRLVHQVDPGTPG